MQWPGVMLPCWNSIMFHKLIIIQSSVCHCQAVLLWGEGALSSALIFVVWAPTTAAAPALPTRLCTAWRENVWAGGGQQGPHLINTQHYPMVPWYDGMMVWWCDSMMVWWCDGVRWLLNSFSQANSAADISPPTNNLGKRSDDLRNSFLVGLCCSQ